MGNLALVFDPVDIMDYADAVGYIRVKERRDLLNGARLNEVLSLTSEMIVENLRQDIHDDSLPQKYILDDVIGAVLKREYSEVETYDHRRMIVTLLRYRHDINNLKALIRNRRWGLEIRLSPVDGNYPIKLLEEYVDNGKQINWPDSISELIRDIVEQAKEEAAGDWVDMQLDLAWLQLGLEGASRNKLFLLARHFQYLDDFAAVKYLWRRSMASRDVIRTSVIIPRTHFLPVSILREEDRESIADILMESYYGQALKEGASQWKSTGSWMALDRDMDNMLIRELSSARFIPLGPEPLAAYLLALEYDLKNMRMACELKKTGWEEGRIKKFLRRTYV